MGDIPVRAKSVRNAAHVCDSTSMAAITVGEESMVLSASRLCVIFVRVVGALAA